MGKISNQLKTPEHLQFALNQPRRSLHLEKIKAAGFATLAAGLSAAVVALAFVVAKVSAILIALIAMPLSIFPPLYGIVVIGVALGAGGSVGYFGVKKVWNFFFEKAKMHWEGSSPRS